MEGQVAEGWLWGKTCSYRQQPALVQEAAILQTKECQHHGCWQERNQGPVLAAVCQPPPHQFVTVPAGPGRNPSLSPPEAARGKALQRDGDGVVVSLLSSRLPQPHRAMAECRVKPFLVRLMSPGERGPESIPALQHPGCCWRLIPGPCCKHRERSAAAQHPIFQIQTKAHSKCC